MPEPWELTPEERAREARELEPRRHEADRQAAALFGRMMFEAEASEEELRAVYPPAEVEEILGYRRGEDIEPE